MTIKNILKTIPIFLLSIFIMLPLIVAVADNEFLYTDTMKLFIGVAVATVLLLSVALYEYERFYTGSLKKIVFKFVICSLVIAFLSIPLYSPLKNYFINHQYYEQTN